MKYNASELVSWIYWQLPEYGSFSRAEMKRILSKLRPELSEAQIEQSIIIAINTGYVKIGHGGATLRRAK